MNEGLKSSVFLFDSEIKDVDETIESIGKKKKIPRNNKTGQHEEPVKPIEVIILQPCVFFYNMIPT